MHHVEEIALVVSNGSQSAIYAHVVARLTLAFTSTAVGPLHVSCKTNSCLKPKSTSQSSYNRLPGSMDVYACWSSMHSQLTSACRDIVRADRMQIWAPPGLLVSTPCFSRKISSDKSKQTRVGSSVCIPKRARTEQWTNGKVLSLLSLQVGWSSGLTQDRMRLTISFS